MEGKIQLDQQLIPWILMPWLESFLSVQMSTYQKSVYSYLSVDQSDTRPPLLCYGYVGYIVSKFKTLFPLVRVLEHSTSIYPVLGRSRPDDGLGACRLLLRPCWARLLSKIHSCTLFLHPFSFFLSSWNDMTEPHQGGPSPDTMLATRCPSLHPFRTVRLSSLARCIKLNPSP